MNPLQTLEPAPALKMVGSLLRQFDGVLTRDLLQEPARFGLGMLPAGAQPDATTTAVCGFCSTGCGLNVMLQNGEAIGLAPATDFPVNLGMACPKGWEALSVLNATDRATTPLVRDARGVMQPVTWKEAAETFRRRFKGIQARHGTDSVAFLSTGQLPTEEMIYLGAFAKFGMGMVHGDGNTRQCMATAATAYKQSFGFDAPPFTYQDFEESDCLVFVGSNPCIAHPIMWQRVLRNPHDPELIVIDPRRTETAMSATEHLAIKPKFDLPLLYGIAREMIHHGWIDQQYIDRHTSGFADFAAHAEVFTPEYVEELSGIEADRIRKVAHTIHQRQRVSFWWTMGVNQSYEGTRTAQAIINLALMTGNIGRPGTGANSITGQCNAMGSRIFSNTTNLFAGRDFANADHRHEVAQILDIDVQRIPSQRSWPYHEIIEGIDRGKIKGLWVVCTNPAHSWIDQNRCRGLLEKLDFLVVQDMYHSTETAQHADLLLPAAGWGEKEGTFINSERRISLLKKVAKAPGQALADFSIFRLLAQHWGCGDMFARWQTPADVFESMKDLSRGRPCDISGIEDYRMLDECGGIQWPFPIEQAGEKPVQQRRLFEDGSFFHADRRAKFKFEQPKTLAEPPSKEYPFHLLTGRGTASQWHTQTRTGKSAVLRKLYPANLYVEINPRDAEREGIGPDQLVTIQSSRGSIQARAIITPTINAGQLFLPMHYEAVNQLTLSHFDPYSHQPSYKDCAVRIRAGS